MKDFIFFLGFYKWERKAGQGIYLVLIWDFPSFHPNLCQVTPFCGRPATAHDRTDVKRLNKALTLEALFQVF